MAELTSGFEKLYDSPDGDVLECGIGAAEEAVEIVVKTSFGFVPDLIESRVVIRSGTPICCEPSEKENHSLQL